VTIPGFYDDVVAITKEEKEKMSALPFDEGGYRDGMGVQSLEGESGFSTLERRWARPTLDVNGMLGGFTGPGSSTVIPAKVMAKVSMRIVPDQDPDKIGKAFDDAVMAAAPAGVKVQILNHASAGAYVSPLGTPGINAAAAALKLGYQKEPFFIREGGTLPILPMFKALLRAESLMMGLCMPNCNAHGPNEFFHESDLHNGARASAHLVDCLSRM
jgi:acetylornithine deacetylase/succinyl-diaminopimelate desuccinylase-like protein